jgi:hypothetical protein
VAGSAVFHASEAVKLKAIKVCAAEFEIDEEDLEVVDGEVRETPLPVRFLGAETWGV